MRTRTRLPQGTGRAREDVGPDFLSSVSLGVAAAFGTIALALEANAAGVDPLIAYVGGSVSCAALPVALRRPILATFVQCVATTALDQAASGPAPDFPFVTFCVLVGHVAVVALWHDWKIAAAVWWTLVAGSVLLATVSGGRSRSDADETLVLVVLASASLIVLLAGIGYRYRRRIRGELAAARRDVEIEQERRTLVEERARIARELHDVVAHSMSVIHMQATSAPYRLADVDPVTRAEFAGIAEGARGALGEMRQLLGVLRESDAEPGTDPAPGLEQLSDLVATTGRYGGPVTLALDPEVGRVPNTVGTTVFRIVQESLSNVVRHARGAAASVRVVREGTRLVVTVVNGPPPEEAGGSDPAIEPVELVEDRPRHGVRGMRERVARLGGDVSHGPSADGGYQVTAHLPLPDDVVDDQLPHGGTTG